jgi:hypothetical protein
LKAKSEKLYKRVGAILKHYIKMNMLEIQNQDTGLFNKRGVLALSENEMITIDGGVAPLIAASSIGCARAAGIAIGALVAYLADGDF